MAVVKKWICDGCGDTTETPIADETSTFYQIRVTAGAWGDDFNLCPKCNEKLLREIDPRKWPRLARVAPHRMDPEGGIPGRQL